MCLSVLLTLSNKHTKINWFPVPLLICLSAHYDIDPAESKNLYCFVPKNSGSKRNYKESSWDFIKSSHLKRIFYLAREVPLAGEKPFLPFWSGIQMIKHFIKSISMSTCKSLLKNTLLTKQLEGSSSWYRKWKKKPRDLYPTSHCVRERPQKPRFTGFWTLLSQSCKTRLKCDKNQII